MIEGQRRLFRIAERDVAQQKLGFRIGVALDQTMLLDEPKSQFGIAAGEHPSGDRLPFRPPGRGPHQITRLGEQNLHRRVDQVLLSS